MVEHQLPKLAFAGSIPVSRSMRHLFTGAFYDWIERGLKRKTRSLRKSGRMLTFWRMDLCGRRAVSRTVNNFTMNKLIENTCIDG